jgi:hypothetical protein
MARPEIAQLVQSGAQLGMGLLQEKRAGDIFDLQKEQVMEERDAATAINQVFQAETELTQKRGQGAQVLGELRKLAAMDPSVRKTQAPVVFQALEQATGTPLAENMKQFLVSAKPEIAGPVMDRLIRGYASDPNQTIDGLLPVLSSPLTSAQTIGQISRDLGDVAAQEAITGPTANPRRDKFQQAKASRERLIAGLEKVVASKGHTKAGEIAQRKIDQLRGELEKMETIISGQDATAMGVRPGTTLTESGTGNVSVLQGPDDSEGGSAGGSVRTADERAMFAFLAPIYADSFNLETGEFKTKTREDSQKLLDVLSRASRIRAESGGKLTASEAAQQAQRELSGAAGIPGVDTGNPYDRPGW